MIIVVVSLIIQVRGSNMIFEGDGFYVDLIGDDDFGEITSVYNSNKGFLARHIGKCIVTEDWVKSEVDCMRKLHFSYCKIVESSTGKLAGIIEFKIEKETYLSLLMLNSEYKSKGCGIEVYKAFEKYAKERGSLCIRIDVVAGYNDKVYSFWRRNGFMEFKNAKLKWGKKILPAVIMKKSLL